MIRLKPFKQSKGYCGPASLKMVLSAYGINKSERDLAKMTKTSRVSGCKESEIIRVARGFGFKAYLKDGMSIRDLKELVGKKITIIVDWFSPEEAGHYSVVVGFAEDDILIADPHFGKIKKHKISWFEERWFDFVPFPPKKMEDVYIKRGIVIYR